MPENKTVTYELKVTPELEKILNKLAIDLEASKSEVVSMALLLLDFFMSQYENKSLLAALIGKTSQVIDKNNLNQTSKN